MVLVSRFRWLLLIVVCHCESTRTAKSLDECVTKELSFVPLKVPAKSSSWSQPLDLYHFAGYEYHPAHLFLDVRLQINLTDDQTFQLYQGENCSTVLEQYHQDQRLFGLLRHVNLIRSKQLNPFGKSVIGIDTVQPYTVRVRVWTLDYIRCAIFFGAILLFLMSHSLVRNVIFYYSSGCIVGLLASLLLIGFIVYRFTPKAKWIGVPVLFGGWSFSFYIVYLVWKNFTSLILQYQKFVAAYFATVILISFAVCYRYGPPTNVRSHNLAQWALQLIALLLIYFSCQVPEVACTVIVCLLFWSLTKKWVTAIVWKILSVLKFIWRLIFPKTRRLLTMEEYEQQGEEETKKALEQLRSYCRSPEANVWKMTSSLSNPRRFASFISGSSDHITEEESRLYEQESTHFEDLSDDSGEDEVVFEQRLRPGVSPLRSYSDYSYGSELRQRLKDRNVKMVHRDEADAEEDEESDDEEYLFVRNTSTRSVPAKKYVNLASSRNHRTIKKPTGGLRPHAVIPAQEFRSPASVNSAHSSSSQHSFLTNDSYSDDSSGKEN